MFIIIRARNVHGGFSKKILVPEIEGQMGVKMGQKWGFRDFLKNGSNDFVFFPTERRYHSVSLVCQATSPEKFWFSRYGVKGGQKWGFSGFSQKLV